MTDIILMLIQNLLQLMADALNLHSLQSSVSNMVLSIGIDGANAQIQNLITAMDKLKGSFAGSGIGTAKAIGGIMCIIIGAKEAFAMMRGDRGFNVLALAKPLVIASLISAWGAVYGSIDSMGNSMSSYAKGLAEGAANDLTAKEQAVKEAQQSMRAALFSDGLAKMTQIELAKEDESLFDKLTGMVSEAVSSMKTAIMEYFMGIWGSALYFIGNIISQAIRMVFEVLFQASFLGIVCVSKLGLLVLVIFGPIFFALSLTEAYSNAWAQWVSRYVTISLYPFIAYLALYFIYQTMIWGLTQDLNEIKSWSEQSVAEMSLIQQMGRFVEMGFYAIVGYVCSLVMGTTVMGFVPEIASWCMPNAQAWGGMGAMAKGMQNAAMAPAKTAVGVATVGIVKA